MKRRIAYMLPVLMLAIIALCIPGVLHWAWRL